MLDNKIVTNKIDSPPVLSCLDLSVPSRFARDRSRIFEVKARINVRKHSTFQRIMTAVNLSQLDISLSPAIFKLQAREHYFT